MTVNQPEMTSPPWPENCEATDEQFLLWFLDQSEEAQMWIMRRLREGDRAGFRCWMMNHDAEIARLRNRFDLDGGAA